MSISNQLIQAIEANKTEIINQWISHLLTYSDVLEQQSVFSNESTVSQLLDIMIQLQQTSDIFPANLILKNIASEQIQRQQEMNAVINFLYLGKQIILKTLIENFNNNPSILSNIVLQLDQSITVLVTTYIDKYQTLLQSSTIDIKTIESSNALPGNYPPLEVYTVVKEMTWTSIRTLNAKQAFLYLKDKNEDFFNPFFSLGDLTVLDKRTFNSEVVEINNSELIHKLFVKREPIFTTNKSDIQGLPFTIIDNFNSQSILVLPLASKNHSLGMLIFCDIGISGAEMEEQIQLSMTIAHAMGLALENELLYEEKKKRLAETDSLRQITFALLQKLNIEEVLEIICTEAQRLTSAHGSAVYMLQDNQWLKAAFRTGETTHASDKWIALKESVLGLTVLRNKPVYINNQKNLEDPLNKNQLSLLAVPLQFNNEPVGIIEVVKKHYGFSKDDIRVINLFAGQAGVAIENARLYQQSEQIAVLEERQRLARNLHDSLNQSIFALNLYAKAAVRHLEANRFDNAKKYLKDITETAKEALAEMRLLVYELHPPQLNQKGLVPAIESRLKKVEERVGIKYILDSNISMKIPSAVEEEMYWIALEALNNTLKHSEANEVTVNLNEVQNSITMEIKDNGTGFDVLEQLNAEGNIGLKSMRDRANLINANLELESDPGQGTKITLEVEL